MALSALQAPPAKRTRRIGVHAEHDSYKWWALSCTSLGMLLATINSGTLIIALPDLERSLKTSLLELVWVILVYMIASTVLVLSAGRLSDQFGRKRAYIGGFLVFAVASLGAGFASGGTELILWRILQGVGGAFLFANAAAIVTDAFPREQLGMAMGTNTMVAAVGLVIGPVLGGALVAIGWHWVFWFNVPFALLGSLWAALVLREVVGGSGDRSFDALGTITFLIGLTGFVFGISKGGLSGWGSPLVIAGLASAAIFLPAFIVIERHHPAPMLDLTIFRNRLFSTASAAAFCNGLARFALMFVFVFYFQGVQGDSPILAGVKLAPLAIGMLISSPLAGIWADRRGSRTLAVLGMLVTALGLALMTTLERDTSYIWPCIYHVHRRDRLGHVQLAQHRRDDGHRCPAPARDRGRRAGPGAEHRRRDLDRVRARGRDLVGPRARPVPGLLGPRQPHLDGRADAVHRQHAHGALVPDGGLDRRRRGLGGAPEGHPRAGRRAGAAGSDVMSATAERPLRIGELAELTGTTPRTIRYYEEIGLLGSESDRLQGKHRLYTQADVERVSEIIRLRDLLGLSLDQLSQLLEAEDARAHLRREYQKTDSPAERKAILERSLGHINNQLELVRGRLTELTQLATELEDKQKLVKQRIRENS